MAPATKGGLHFLARQGGCMVFPRAKPGCEGFIQTGVFYQFIGAHNNPRAKGASNLSPLSTFGPAGRQPSSPKGASAPAPSYCCKYREAPAMSLILDIHGDPWYHISNFKEGNDKKSRASQMAKRAACGESSAGGPPEDGLGASGPNGQARRDCPLQQQGIYGIVRRTCQVLFR